MRGIVSCPPLSKKNLSSAYENWVGKRHYARGICFRCSLILHASFARYFLVWVQKKSSREHLRMIVYLFVLCTPKYIPPAYKQFQLSLRTDKYCAWIAKNYRCLAGGSFFFFPCCWAVSQTVSNSYGDFPQLNSTDVSGKYFLIVSWCIMFWTRHLST